MDEYIGMEGYKRHIMYIRQLIRDRNRRAVSSDSDDVSDSVVETDSPVDTDSSEDSDYPKVEQPHVERNIDDVGSEIECATEKPDNGDFTTDGIPGSSITINEADDSSSDDGNEDKAAGEGSTPQDSEPLSLEQLRDAYLNINNLEELQSFYNLLKEEFKKTQQSGYREDIDFMHELYMDCKAKKKSKAKQRSKKRLANAHLSLDVDDSSTSENTKNE